MKTSPMAVPVLWFFNYKRPWIQHLYKEFQAGAQGKDFDTIRYWIEQFKRGVRATITVDTKSIVQDGNHRLVAAKIAEIDYLDIEVVDLSDYCEPEPVSWSETIAKATEILARERGAV